MNEKMDRIHLRPATASDSAFVFGTKKAALGPYISETGGWDEDEQRALHTRRFHPGRSRIVLLGDRPAGVLTVDRGASCIHLRQLFILPEFQKRGIGTRVARQLVEESDHSGLPVALQVLKSNPRAKAFYERLGFQTEGETRTHHQMRRNSQPDGRHVQ